jgi:HAE1 family hydrophobic/amphiphilic exporter-1
MNITKTAITRPVFIFVLMLATILMGIISYSSMRKEQNPEVSFGVVTVLSIYPGASPDEVATLVSRPIEEAVTGVNGVRDVLSTSAEGRSVVTVQLEIGVDQDVALADVRAKVDAVINRLPTDVEKPTISRVDTSSTPVVYMALSADKISARDLRTLVDDKLKDRFARIGGVSEVGVIGGDVREIQVAVKKDQLLRYGIGLSDVQRAVAAATINLPAGRIVDGDDEFSVRIPGEFTSPDQLNDLVFTISDPTNPQAKAKLVRLGDVATITDGIAERTSYSTLDSVDTVVMVLSKAREGNAIDILNAANAAMKELEGTYKDTGLRFVVTQNQAIKIQESLDDLNLALFLGIFLVAVIVQLFLHNFRGTLIVILAIPTSLMGTFFALKMAGFTINNLTMLALSLSIGVLVDDAIVVLENIYRHLKLGESPRQAALNGRAEIGVAAIAITLADVAVFLPIANLSGIVGQFFKPLALGYVFAVLFSLFVSFTLTPMLASRWYRQGENVEHPVGRFSQWFERVFGRFERFYGRILESALKHRWTVFVTGNFVLVSVFMVIQGSVMGDVTEAAKRSSGIAGFVLIVGLVVFVINLFYRRFKPMVMVNAVLLALCLPLLGVVGFKIREWKQEDLFKFQFFPASDTGSLAVNIQLPPGRSLEATQRVVDTVEERIKDIPEITYLLATVGSQGASQFAVGSSGSNYAQVAVSLHEKKALLDYLPWAKHDEQLRTRSSDSVSAEIIQRIGRIPGAEIRVAATDGFGGGSAIQMSLSGNNRDQILETASAIKRGLAGGAIPGVINPDISSKPGKPELRALPDRTRLADAGLTVADVANALRISYTGDETTKYREKGREFDIRVMLDFADRNNPDILSQLPVRFRQGEPIFLSSVTKLGEGTSIDNIQRRNREEEVRVTADLLPGAAAGTIQAQINTWLEKEKLVQEGIRVKPLGQAESQSRESGALLSAIFLGLLLVYMVLASLYDNWLYPFIIQLCQPQAFVGALLALMITNKPFNLVGFIGLITLIGLVGKNAILLVDYTNTLRGRGRSRHDALVESGPTRLRPIMMTTIALILGTLPIALAVGRGSEFRETIGIVIIGGISLSTILTLIVIPCSYSIFDDLSNWISWLRTGRKGRPSDLQDLHFRQEALEVDMEPAGTAAP